MAFLQSYMLWGMLAVAVPVAIHFWYQKKGKTIEWAATRWLGEQTTLQHRGIRLNEIWLMLLRCLLVILLALILSKPVVDWFNRNTRPSTLHLVQQDRLVTDAYRFELEKALRNGEEIYWIGPLPEKAENLAEMSTGTDGLSHLQQNINALSNGITPEFKLYFRNDETLQAFSKVYIPGGYQLFPVVDSVEKKTASFKPKADQPAPIRVLIALKGDEEHAVKAALAALTEVYGFEFEITSKNRPGTQYDLIFTHKPADKMQPGTTCIVPGNARQWNVTNQVIQLRDTLNMANSELVESGRLPEWLGELVINKLKLKTDRQRLSKKQLNALFEKTNPVNGNGEAASRSWLLLIFVMLMIAERWMALRKPLRNHG
jgi:hypothetical protein